MYKIFFCIKINYVNKNYVLFFLQKGLINFIFIKSYGLITQKNHLHNNCY